MKSLSLIIGILLAALAFSGCSTTTTFLGSAHVTRDLCLQKCKGWGMTLVGMVAIGEYSDACVCRFQNHNGTSASITDEDLLLSTATSAAASDGVTVQSSKTNQPSTPPIVVPPGTRPYPQ
jgi:hypothetical protein